jgi:hypothetical protein
MASKFEEKFEKLFKEIEGLTDAQSLPKMESFVHDSLQFFEFIRVKLSSEDEEERKEAMNLAQKLQDKLTQQTEKALKASGMNEDQLQSFLAQPSNFNPEEWATFEKSQKEIQDYQSTVFTSTVPKIEGIKESKITDKKPKKGKGDWIAG